ncbi:MAG: protein kinase domain-containing protein, partial [Acidobacteriota bacterium]
QLCAGLAAAHDAGVIHRDLKPDNVLVERGTERVVISDFGIARSGDDHDGVTQVGAVVGTPRYMAPEQLAGREVDARADLFSLGVMLFELATGMRPWAGDNAIAVAVAQATSPPRTIEATARDVPAAFATIVAECLHLEPERRPASAELIGAALAAGDASLLASATRAARPAKAARVDVPATVAPPEPTSLAVLPFQCAPADEYLADGVVEDLTDALSTTAGLRVRPAGFVRTQPAPDPREVGRGLQVDHVVVGTLRRTPQGLRLNARLIGVVDGFQIWASKLECSEAEILAASAQLVQGVAGALSTRATSSTRPTDPRAVDLYLRARAEQRRYWATHAQAAADLLEQAAAIAPTSPQILGALAHATVQAWVFTGKPEVAARARVHVERALATGHGEAYIASAQYHFNQGQFERGGRDLGIALARAPMSATAHELAANILVEIDSTGAARHHYETAIGLDPGRADVIASGLARLEALEGKFEAADARIAALVANLDPSVVQLGLVMSARLAGWRGRPQQLLAAARQFTPRMGADAARFAGMVSHAIDTGNLDAEQWRSLWTAFEGDHDRPVRQQLMGLQILSELLLMIGKVDAAFDTLDAAARLGLMDRVWIDSCPLFQGLGTRQRYHAIRGKVAARASAVLTALRASIT